MFERKQNGSPGGDCTVSYGIELDRQYTLQEFIDDIIQNYPNGYGSFRLYERDKWISCKEVQYGYGLLGEEIPMELSNRPISSISVIGDWNRMDYIIRMED